MVLAIFDLDNTLIAHDSDYLWSEYMMKLGIVEEGYFRTRNDCFHRQYLEGALNIYDYLDFCLEPLTRYSMNQLNQWHQRFMEESIKPVMLQKGVDLINLHRQQGHHIMIITATSYFVTASIAEAFGVDTLLAIDAEIKDNRYTAKVTGQPTFRKGRLSVSRSGYKTTRGFL